MKNHDYDLIALLAFLATVILFNDVAGFIHFVIVFGEFYLLFFVCFWIVKKFRQERQNRINDFTYDKKLEDK